MTEQAETKPGLRRQYPGAGIGLGAALGVALGSALGQVALGLAFGTALGSVLDVVSYASRKKPHKPALQSRYGH